MENAELKDTSTLETTVGIESEVDEEEEVEVVVDGEHEETEARKEQQRERSRIGGLDTKSNPFHGGHEAEAMPGPMWVDLGPPTFQRIAPLLLMVYQVVLRLSICGLKDFLT